MAVALLLHRQAIPVALPRTHIHTIKIILKQAWPAAWLKHTVLYLRMT